MKIEFSYWKITLAVFCAIAITGCSVIPGFKAPLRLSDTPKFYAPRIDSPRAPKPDDAPMPVLSFPPKRKFIVLGTFRMRSKYYDYDFMTEAAVYNARRLGADAVLLRDRWITSRTFTYRPNVSGDDDNYVPGPPVTETVDKDHFEADIIIYK